LLLLFNCFFKSVFGCERRSLPARVDSKRLLPFSKISSTPTETKNKFNFQLGFTSRLVVAARQLFFCNTLETTRKYVNTSCTHTREQEVIVTVVIEAPSSSHNKPKMTTTPSKPIHVLRSLLRHLKTGQAKTTTAAPAAPATTTKTATASLLSPTQSFVLQQYRTHQQQQQQSIMNNNAAGGGGSVKETADVVRLKQLANDVLILQRELRAREELYQMDASAETAFTPMEMSRRAAARAGLQLPDLNPKLE